MTYIILEKLMFVKIQYRGMWERLHVRSVRIIVLALVQFVFTGRVQAAPDTIHLQGKLTNPDGTNVTNGTYSLLLTIYDGGSDTGGGTSVWSETQSAVVTDGIFDIQLGSVNQTLATAVDFSHKPLYLSVKVGSDPEMIPYILFSSSPYALNADKLGGVAASGYVRLSPPTQQTGSINISGDIQVGGTYNGNTFTGDSLIFGGASAANIQSYASQALNLVGNAASMVSTTAGNLTLQAGSGTVSLGTSAALTANGALSVTSTGANALTLDSGTTGGVNLGTGANAKAVAIGNTTGATTVTNYVGAGTNAYSIQGNAGSIFFQIDTSTGRVYIGNPTADGTGVLLVFDTKNTSGDPTGVNGSEYYNSVTNSLRCYENGFWSDCASTRYLGGTTLSSSSSVISVALAAATDDVTCTLNITGRSATSYPYMRFNADGSSIYAWNANGIVATATTDWQDSNDTEIQLSGTQTATAATPFSAHIHITNLSGTNKIVDWSASGLEAINTNSNHYDGVGGYYSTAQATSVNFYLSAGTFNTGSRAWCEGR